jgi:hypothetical protein
MGRAARERHHRRRKQPTGLPHTAAKCMNRSLAALGENDNIDRGDRDEPVDLAGRRHCSGGRAAPGKQARTKRGRAAAAAIAGARRLGRPAALSTGSRSPSRRGATASGWPVGCVRTASKRGPAPAKAGVIHPNSIAVSREHRRAKPIGSTRAAETELSRSAARRAGTLRHGGDPEPGRGGRQAAEPRAREPRRRTHAHRQPDQEHARTPRRPRLQADPAHGRAAARAAAHAGKLPLLSLGMRGSTIPTRVSQSRSR